MYVNPRDIFCQTWSLILRWRIKTLSDCQILENNRHTSRQSLQWILVRSHPRYRLRVRSDGSFRRYAEGQSFRTPNPLIGSFYRSFWVLSFPHSLNINRLSPATLFGMGGLVTCTSGDSDRVFTLQNGVWYPTQIVSASYKDSHTSWAICSSLSQD